MKTNFYLFYVVILATSLLFPACQGSQKNEPENPNESTSPNEPTSKGVLAKMDIIDAKTLFLAPANYNTVPQMADRKASNDNSVVLFKITEDGIIKRVTFLDENQNEITEEYSPKEILLIDNSPYFFVDFQSEIYLVNKLSGAVYKCPDLSIEKKQYGTRYFINEHDIVTDNEGNLYYSSNRRIHKIDISDINNVADEAISPESDGVDKFVISSNGEIYYCYYRDGYLHRLRSVGGKLIPYSITTDGGNYDNIAYRGLDGKIHIFDRGALQIITFGDYGNISADTITTNVLNTIYELEYDGGTTKDPYLITYPDRIIAIGAISQALILDSNNPDDITGAIFNINNYMSIADLHYNSSYIYCCGQTIGQYSIVRINPYTYNSDVIFQDANYEIYSFTVDDNETITFNGLRLSDGKMVIASINKEGKFNTLSESSNSERVVLERLQ
jgi:hypothetical protein